MDTPDKAAEIKAAAAALIAFGTALFGWVGWMVVLWLAAMALDYLTGTFAALYNKTWSSAAARRGLWHKLGSIFGVLVAAMCDLVLRLVGDNFGFELPLICQSCLITPIVAAWYFFTELGSIVENAAAMGAPVPDFLKKLIARGKKTIDDKTGDGDNEE